MKHSKQTRDFYYRLSMNYKEREMLRALVQFHNTNQAELLRKLLKEEFEKHFWNT